MHMVYSGYWQTFLWHWEIALATVRRRKSRPVKCERYLAAGLLNDLRANPRLLMWNNRGEPADPADPDQ